jgi:hypothetical protein
MTDAVYGEDGGVVGSGGVVGRESVQGVFPAEVSGDGEGAADVEVEGAGAGR